MTHAVSALRLACVGLAVSFASSGCWLFAPTGLDGFVEAFLRADCRFAFACCTPPERAEFVARNFRDEGACVAEGLEEGSGANVVVDRAKAVLAAGKGEFDQERADACLQPLLDARNNCDAEAVLGGAPADPLCAAEQARGFVVGNVEDGDECNDDIECADFGVCDRSENDDDVITTAGECRAARAEGEECIDPETFEAFACFPGTFCQQDGDSFTCQEADLKGDGEPCDANGECESGICDDDGSTFACFFDGAPCTEETEAVDCDVALGDSCEPTDVCVGRDVTVEVCDGV